MGTVIILLLMIAFPMMLSKDENLMSYGVAALYVAIVLLIVGCIRDTIRACLSSDEPSVQETIRFWEMEKSRRKK